MLCLATNPEFSSGSGLIFPLSNSSVCVCVCVCVCVYINIQAIYRLIHQYVHTHTHTHTHIRALSPTLWKVQQLTLAAHVHTHTQYTVSDSRNCIWAPTAVNTTLTNRRFVGKQTIPICQDKYFTSLHLLTQEGSYLCTSTHIHKFTFTVSRTWQFCS